MEIFWATRLRGFLRHMSQHMQNVTFADSGQYYEVASLRSKLASKLIRSPLLDPIGLFQILKVSGKNCDYYGSFNRFLQADKPYFIYLENPTALYHYALGRIRFPAGRKRFAACLNDPNLKYIVCMADACRVTFEKINMPVPEQVKMATIYPFVPQNAHADPEQIREKSKCETMECLFCAQGRRFLTKGGLDVLEAYKNLRAKGYNIHLRVITKLSELDRKTLEKLNTAEGVSIHDFSFSYSELEEIYAKTNVLIHPSSDDSVGLTILEAMKGGCAIVGSDLYGFTEMVEPGGNGMLLEPKYRIFTKDFLPNPRCWKRWKKLHYSRKKDPAFIARIEKAVETLYLDREKLCAFALRSLELANTKFGEDTICDQWKDVWNMLEGCAVNET